MGAKGVKSATLMLLHINTQRKSMQKKNTVTWNSICKSSGSAGKSEVASFCFKKWN